MICALRNAHRGRGLLFGCLLLFDVVVLGRLGGGG